MKTKFIAVKQIRNNSVEEINSVRNRYFTFGVEIECFNIERRKVQRDLGAVEIESLIQGYNHNDQKVAYKLGEDGSIGGFMSCEVVSPVLTNFTSLKKVCEVLNANGAEVNSTCGLHVHFGVANFSCHQIIKLMLDYTKIQGIVNSMMPFSRRHNRYCGHLKEEEISRLMALQLRPENEISMNDVIACVGDRYRTINIHAYRTHKTIEFRQHNGTTNYLKIRAWILFLLSFINLSLKGFDFSSVESFDDLPINKTIIPYFKERIKKFEDVEL